MELDSGVEFLFSGGSGRHSLYNFSQTYLSAFFLFFFHPRLAFHGLVFYGGPRRLFSTMKIPRASGRTLYFILATILLKHSYAGLPTAAWLSFGGLDRVDLGGVHRCRIEGLGHCGLSIKHWFVRTCNTGRLIH